MSVPIISIVIGIVAATAALWLAFNMRGVMQRIGSALVMGVAVCGMHYTGMFAITMTPNANSMQTITSTFPAETLAISIFTISIGLMFFLLLMQQFRVNSSRRV